MVMVRVSGAADPVRAEVEPMPDGSWKGTVEMPRPAAVENVRLPGGISLPAVRFDGITHILLEKTIPDAQAEELIKQWCGHLGADALGLMFLDMEKKKLRPLVYVPAAGTLCWENSCASGTTACGAYLAAKAGGSVCETLRQPGGSLRVEVTQDGRFLLGGTIRLLKNASAEFPELPG